MELLKLSKFKLQLRALIAEFEQLKERERSGAEQLNHSNQKQKQTEEDFTRKLQELQSELDASHDSRRKLESKVKYLENDNILLENKQKELKGTIDGLLQSREAFVSLYEDSTCEIRRSIEIRDRRIAFLSEKLKAHFLLFETIEKEAVSVKQIVYRVQQIVSDKEAVVVELTRKLDKISSFEKDFFDKINVLENKLRHSQDESRRKDTHISELQGQLEAAKINNDYHPKIEELQKSLSMKDEVIESIREEKKALRCEVLGLEIALRKIQDAVMRMDPEDQKLISSALEDQGECAEMTGKENYRPDNADVKCRRETLYDDGDHKAEENKGSNLWEDDLREDELNEDHNMDSSLQEGKCPPIAQHQLDSESSTTERKKLNCS